MAGVTRSLGASQKQTRRFGGPAGQWGALSPGNAMPGLPGQAREDWDPAQPSAARHGCRRTPLCQHPAPRPGPKWVLSDPGHGHGDLRYATDPCRASRPSLPGDGALGGEMAAGTHGGVDEHCPQRGNGWPRAPGGAGLPILPEAAALGPCAAHSLCPPAAGAPPRGSLLLAPQRLHTERAGVCKARGALIHTLPKPGTPEWASFPPQSQPETAPGPPRPALLSGPGPPPGSSCPLTAGSLAGLAQAGDQ